MLSSSFANFLFLLLYRHRSKHGVVFIIALLIITLLSSVMFLAGAVRKDVGLTLDDQADMVVQRMRAGKAVNLPADWVYDLGSINGVTAAVPRVYGRYFHEPNGQYFTVVGVDLFDNQVTRSLEELVENLDAREFLAEKNMIIGQGVQDFLAENHYLEQYDFKTPQQKTLSVQVYDSLPASSSLVSHDLVIVELDLARQILGIAPDQATDIVMYVPNELEGDSVMGKAIGLHYDIRVIQKKEIATAYANLFNFKGGAFLLLYVIVLVTFLLILYQRYSMITGSDRREIGIMRAVGWSIRDVIALKVAESLLVAVGAYLLGVVLAYFLVFGLNAPLLAPVFFGFENLPGDLTAGRIVEPGLLGLLFLFFVIPFIAAVLLPVWRIAVIDPVEAMK